MPVQLLTDRSERRQEAGLLGVSFMLVGVMAATKGPDALNASGPVQKLETRSTKPACRQAGPKQTQSTKTKTRTKTTTTDAPAVGVWGI
jgi:hypothetical protein